MAQLNSLCIYCGASTGQNEAYMKDAQRIGELCAEKGVKLVFGGGSVGLMGAAARATMDMGGQVHGIIPQHLFEMEVGFKEITELDIVDNMHIRKMRMFNLSDAFVVMPGGLGTLDETFEMVTWRQLGLHDKPLILLNTNGFWTPLIDLVKHQINAGFVKPHQLNYFQVANRPEEVFEMIQQAPEQKITPRPELS